MSELADLLEKFRRGAEVLAVVTTGVAGTELDFKPSEKAWSIRQVVCHLADSEAVAVMRLRQVAAEENPTLQAFNGELWADKLDYAKRKLSVAMETFRRLRTENHEMLKDLPEDAFERAGNHTESGRVTLLDLVQGNAGHVEEHVQQIQRNRAAYREHKAKLQAAS
jgi:hypothetical protein